MSLSMGRLFAVAAAAIVGVVHGCVFDCRTLRDPTSTSTCTSGTALIVADMLFLSGTQLDETTGDFVEQHLEVPTLMLDALGITELAPLGLSCFGRAAPTFAALNLNGNLLSTKTSGRV